VRNTRDSFLHLLKDNLSASIPVHNVRFDKNNPNSAVLQTNAVNVTFLITDYEVQVSSLMLKIDIVHEDELIAVDWAKAVSDILLSAAYTHKMDYSSGTPVDTGVDIFWNPYIKFRPIYDDYSYRLNALITLHHKKS
jgi:hypothetical protein